MDHGCRLSQRCNGHRHYFVTNIISPTQSAFWRLDFSWLFDDHARNRHVVCFSVNLMACRYSSLLLQHAANLRTRTIDILQNQAQRVGFLDALRGSRASEPRLGAGEPWRTLEPTRMVMIFVFGYQLVTKISFHPLCTFQ
jgi:hypothetical protein